MLLQIEKRLWAKSNQNILNVSVYYLCTLFNVYNGIFSDAIIISVVMLRVRLVYVMQNNIRTSKQ